MRLAAAVLLVVVLLLVTLPVVVSGMDLDACPSCPDGMTAGVGLCFVLAGAVVLFLASVLHPFRLAPDHMRAMLLGRSPDRPPRRP